MKGWRANVLVLVGLCGCSVDVASLKVVAPRPLDAEDVRTATSRGWREGESCRFWLLGAPFGLPQVDQAIEDAMRPVDGAFMRDVTARFEETRALRRELAASKKQ